MKNIKVTFNYTTSYSSGRWWIDWIDMINTLEILCLQRPEDKSLNAFLTGMKKILKRNKKIMETRRKYE